MSEFKNTKFYPIFKKLTEKGCMQEKDYQLEGINWAINNETGKLPYDIRGGIIADEMGLGKTFQVISVLVCNFKPRTLIVLPPILIQQWVESFVKITGHKPLIYHSKFVKLNDVSFEKLNTSPVVITTYGMLTTTKKKERNILHSISWSRVIYDEAHHLKNRNTSVFKGAKELNAKIKWFITGTPIQNKINDFYSLCDLLGISRSVYRDVENHKIIKQNFILRRTKQDVDISVPPVKLTHVKVPIKNKVEETIADELHSILPYYVKSKARLLGEYDEEEGNDEDEEDLDYDWEENAEQIIIEPEPDNEDTQLFPEASLFDLIYSKSDDNVLPVFMRAKQLCIYPPMFQALLNEHKNSLSYRDFTIYNKALQSTYKLDVITRFIHERKDNENRKIVFCYFKKEIDYIHHNLNMMNIKTDIIDGRTTNTRKIAILSERPSVLLLQIQTSCEGLNLQDYSEVYFTAPHWNPAIESQAIARCHRIGQTKCVYVFKFMSVISSAVSMDQYIIGIQNKKRGYARLITDKGG